jgi:S1-C subfamily serine protease
VAGVFFEHYVFPRLGDSKYFSRFGLLKSLNEDVTVINKTEQIFVKEETTIDKISNQASSSVVNIISFPGTVSAGPAAAGPIKPKNGTGVIATSDGLIMTHVSAIDPSGGSFKVLTADGGEYEAEFLGTDAYSQLSFFKINAGNLPAISFGNSGEARPGEKVVAVGNSFETYSNRYAGGLLSSFDPAYNLAGKSLSFSDRLEGVFQTDFNSAGRYLGGPVIDYSGQMVGIFGTLERNGFSEFFLIPSNKVKKVMERAIRRELNTAPSLGIYYIPLTKTYSESRNLSRDKGAIIFSYSGQQSLAMIAGSAGQKAGFLINDIITHLNGQEINLENPLPDLLYQYKKGERIELTIIRNGEELKIPVNL